MQTFGQTPSSAIIAAKKAGKEMWLKQTYADEMSNQLTSSSIHRIQFLTAVKP